MRTRYELSNDLLRASQFLRWRTQSRSETPAFLARTRVKNSSEQSSGDLY